MACRGFAVGHEFFRIFVAQRIERERAALRHVQRLGEQLGGIQIRQAQPQPQVALGVGVKRMATLGYWHADANCGERVLHPAARAHVHVHVARCNERQTRGFTQIAQFRKAGAIVRPAQQFHCDPGATWETLGEPARFSFSPLGERAGVRGQKQRKTSRQSLIEVSARQTVTTLLSTPPTRGDQLGEIAVSLTVGGKQHQFRAVLEPDLGADNERQAAILRGNMRAHDARERAFIGNSERRVAKLDSSLYQFFRMRCAAQESEVREAV